MLDSFYIFCFGSCQKNGSDSYLLLKTKKVLELTCKERLSGVLLKFSGLSVVFDNTNGAHVPVTGVLFLNNVV